MPIQVTIKEDHTEEFKDAKDLAIERALEIIGMKAEKYAKGNCPTGSPKTTGIDGYIGGTLKNSITYVTAKHSGRTVTVDEKGADPRARNHGGSVEAVEADKPESVAVGTNVFYAPYVELGTSKMEARPFIKPAIFDHLDYYRNIILKELEKG